MAAKEAAGSRSLRLTGDSLKRPPRRYDADYPLIEDLKRKDFIFSARVSDKELAEGDSQTGWRILGPVLR